MQEKLPPDYISGFVDGEGCFSLFLRRDRHLDRKRGREYFYWVASFSIMLDQSDIGILEKIQNTIGCGKVSITGKSAQYQIRSLDELTTHIIPFFDNHPLRAKKKLDYLTWKEAVRILAGRKRQKVNAKPGTRGFITNPLKPDEQKQLLDIKQKMSSTKTTLRLSKWL